jgi:hypothetical protein
MTRLSASLSVSLLASVWLLFAPGCRQADVEQVAAPTPPVGERLVRGLTIHSVVLNQAVAQELYRAEEGFETSEIPVLAGRPGLIRVHVRTQSSWQDRRVRGELTLTSESLDVTTTWEEELEIKEDSSSDDFESTFNFILGAEDIAADTRLAVRLWEAEEPPVAAGTVEGAAWPELGSAPLHATDWGGTVRVKLLPFIYLPDGSERLPATSPDQIQILTDNLMRLYPLRSIEVEVLEPYPSDIEMLSDGTGFSDLLSLVSDLREEWEIPFDTAVFGMVAPAATQQEFCQFGCTAGLAYRVASPRNSKFKSGVGLAYEGEGAARTLAHELGHIHDRGHAPCGGAGNADEDFPYAGGGIGVEGWDVLEEEWIDPQEHDDVMGYCKPDWVSDYTFAALHQRISAVEGLRGERDTLESSDWLTFQVDGAGTVRRPRVQKFSFVPEGPPLIARLLDEEGALLGTEEASLMRYGDLPGGVVVLPSPGSGVSTVQLEGYAPLSL